jgi:LEA14-like dessication related protein
VKTSFSKGIWCAVLCALVLTACASLEWHKPKLSLADVHVTGGNLFEKRLVLTVRVSNDNNMDIVLDSLTFDLMAGDFAIAHGARNEPITLTRKADTLVDIPATARALELVSRLPGLVQSDGRLAYVIKGEALIHGYGAVPFAHEDHLDLQKLLGGLAGRAATASAPSAVTPAEAGSAPSPQ